VKSDIYDCLVTVLWLCGRANAGVKEADRSITSPAMDQGMMMLVCNFPRLRSVLPSPRNRM